MRILIYKIYYLDSLLINSLTGFVSGQKVMLPENVERKDSQLCEEVHIPVPPAAVLEVGNNPVMISSLDEVDSAFILSKDHIDAVNLILNLFPGGSNGVPRYKVVESNPIDSL